MDTIEDYASNIRQKIDSYNNLIDDLSFTLKQAKELGIEVDLADATNSEIIYDYDGIDYLKLKIKQITYTQKL